jgi:Predicted N-acetylglucosamine kinase
VLSLWLGGNFCEAPALRGISDAQILVVDAGATKTSAVLVQVGSGENVEVIASVRTGPANPVSVGWETAVQNLWQACEEVLRGFRSEQSSKPKVHYAVLAIAGTGKEETRSRLAQAFAGLGIAESFCILPDVALLVAGVSNEGVGIALVAGTGSASWGINSTGQVARTGGWGFFSTIWGVLIGWGGKPWKQPYGWPTVGIRKVSFCPESSSIFAWAGSKT